MKKAKQWAAISMILAGNALAACTVVSPKSDEQHKAQFEADARQAVEFLHRGEFIQAGESFVSLSQDCDGAFDAEQLGQVCANLEVIKKYAHAMVANKGSNPVSWTALGELDNANIDRLVAALNNFTELLDGVDHDLRVRLLEPVVSDLMVVHQGLEHVVTYRAAQPPSESSGVRKALFSQASSIDDVIRERRNKYAIALRNALR